MQCTQNCRGKIWETNDALKLEVDPKTDCAIGKLPECPDCKKLARPNVLMFGDWGYISNRLDEQTSNYRQFKTNLSKEKANLLIIELGAGTAVPTVRNQSESMFTDSNWTADFIRVNPQQEHSVVSRRHTKDSKAQTVELTLDALTALTLIDEAIKKKQKE
jgi:NAD-dependent SIR2 family protein deacetylase